MSETKLDQTLRQDSPEDGPRVVTGPRGVIPITEFFPGLLKKPLITSPAADEADVDGTELDIETEQVPATVHALVGLAADQANINADGTTVLFATVVAGAIEVAAGVFEIPAGVRAKITANLHVGAGSGDGPIKFAITDADNVQVVGSKAGFINTVALANSGKGPGVPAVAIVGPFAVATSFKVRIITALAGEAFDLEADGCSLIVEQISGTSVEYTHAGTQVQVRNAATGALVFDSGDEDPAAELAVDVAAELAFETEYEVRARHLTTQGMWTEWSDWQAFTTAAAE